MSKQDASKPDASKPDASKPDASKHDASKHVAQVLSALQQSRERKRGAAVFVRVHSAASIREAGAALSGSPGWRWHELDARSVSDGRAMLVSARTLTQAEDEVCLLFGLPEAAGPKANPQFYEAMAGQLGLVEASGGARVVFLVGVRQLQAFSKLAPSFWERRRAFVAWPVPERPAERPIAVDPSARTAGEAVAPERAEVVMKGLATQLQGAINDVERGHALQKLALLLSSQGRIEEARVSATKAARAFKDEGELKALAQCYELLGSLAERRGNLDVARDWIGFSLEAWHQIGDELRMSECHAKAGHLSYVLGDREQAAQQFQLAVEIDEALGQKKKVAAGLRRLGLMAEEEQKFAIAEKLYADSVTMCEAEGDDMGLSRSYHAVGRLLERQGNYVAAFEQHKRSLEIKERLDDRLGMATSYHHLGNTYLSTQELDQALACYQQALAIEDEVGDHPGRASTLQQLGEVSMSQYRWGDALWYFLAAHYIWRQLGSPQQHAAAVHVTRAEEMLEAEVIQQIRADVKEKLSAYAPG